MPDPVTPEEARYIADRWEEQNAMSPMRRPIYEWYLPQ